MKDCLDFNLVQVERSIILREIDQGKFKAVDKIYLHFMIESYEFGE